jgi:hypothetical protein
VAEQPHHDDGGGQRGRGEQGADDRIGQELAVAPASVGDLVDEDGEGGERDQPDDERDAQRQLGGGDGAPGGEEVGQLADGATLAVRLFPMCGGQ